MIIFFLTNCGQKGESNNLRGRRLKFERSFLSNPILSASVIKGHQRLPYCNKAWRKIRKSSGSIGVFIRCVKCCPFPKSAAIYDCSCIRKAWRPSSSSSSSSSCSPTTKMQSSSHSHSLFFTIQLLYGKVHQVGWEACGGGGGGGK